jgi:dihydrodipicolinate synthase/N-acetylneuraminate lyase
MKPDPRLVRRLKRGMVIPAHPLALDASRRLDERHQRALTRYYLSAGAGGLAVGVHTTQFEIHRPKVGLLRPVLELAAETAREQTSVAPIMIAGVIGKTSQAVREARLARDLGYDLALVSLAAFPRSTNTTLVDHLRRVGEILPMMGFYLQPAVGGRELSYAFWRRALELEQLVAIKVAPFDRYRTTDVVRAVAESGRTDVALYTGNDDHIVLDLVTPYKFQGRRSVTRFVGGLLGQWAMWTSKAVGVLEECRTVSGRGSENVLPSLLRLGAQLTDANGAIFDAANGFAGVLPGVHQVLRRQGLLRGTWCLDPDIAMSRGQRHEIDRVLDAYPQLADDTFVREHLDDWLR